MKDTEAQQELIDGVKRRVNLMINNHDAHHTWTRNELFALLRFIQSWEQRHGDVGHNDS